MKVATIFGSIFGVIFGVIFELLTWALTWELECEKVQTHVWTYWWRPTSGLALGRRSSRSRGPDPRMQLQGRGVQTYGCSRC